MYLKHRGQLRQGYEQVQKKISVSVIIAIKHCCVTGWQIICPWLACLPLVLCSPCPIFLLSDASSVKAVKDPVFVNLRETADLICVADANPIISGMFSWKFLVRASISIHTYTTIH